MATKLQNLLEKNLSITSDFPKKGIMFQDIFSLTRKPKILKKIINEITKIVKKEKITKIIGIDARGFIFALTAPGRDRPAVRGRRPVRRQRDRR